MKIVVVNNKFYRRGGPETYMIKFMDMIRENGHTAIPFAFADEKNLPSDYAEYFPKRPRDKKGIAGVVSGALTAFDNKEADKCLRRLIREEKPDLIFIIVQINGLSPGLIKVAKEEGVPVIHRFSDFFMACPKYSFFRDGNVCEECMHRRYRHAVKHKCSKNSRLVSLLRVMTMRYHNRKKYYDMVDRFMTPSTHTKSLMVRDGCLTADRITHNPTYIDCTAITPRYDNDGYVLCLGRFSPEKGFEYVVDAFRRLKDIPVKVWVTGDKENATPELLRMIEEGGLQDKVHFTGFITGKTLDDAISGAMCVACPAIWYENMPNVLLESFSHGKPVIASRIGSMAEVVQDGKTGLLFEPKNVEQIAACIRKLHENPSLTEELGKNARKTCETEYSPEKHWQRFTGICREIGVNMEGS